MVIRSREFGDGSEYDIEGSTDSIIPDHYVKRLWRKPTLTINGGTGKTVGFFFFSKDRWERWLTWIDGIGTIY